MPPHLQLSTLSYLSRLLYLFCLLPARLFPSLYTKPLSLEIPPVLLLQSYHSSKK